MIANDAESFATLWAMARGCRMMVAGQARTVDRARRWLCSGRRNRRQSLSFPLRPDDVDQACADVTEGPPGLPVSLVGATLFTAGASTAHLCADVLSVGFWGE